MLLRRAPPTVWNVLQVEYQRTGVVFRAKTVPRVGFSLRLEEQCVTYVQKESVANSLDLPFALNASVRRLRRQKVRLTAQLARKITIGILALSQKIGTNRLA